METADTAQITAALIAAQGKATSVFKAKRNQAQNYNYAGIEEFVEAARPVLSENGLALTFSVINVVPLDPRTTARGGQMFAMLVNMDATLHHVSGQSLRFSGAGEGVDSGDKATFKAITGARKYLIAQILNLATTDDPEADGAPATRGNGYQQQPPQQQRQAPFPQQRQPETSHERSAPVLPENHQGDAVDAMTDNELAQRAQFLIRELAAIHGKQDAEILTAFSARAGKPGVDTLARFFSYTATDPEKHAKAMDLLRYAVRRMAASLVKAKQTAAPAPATEEVPDEIPF